MSKPNLVRSVSAVLIVRTSCSSTMRRRGARGAGRLGAAASPLVAAAARVQAVLLASFAAGLGCGEADVDVEFAAGFFFLGGDEVVELAAGGEPFFAAVEVDVVDRQPAG